MRRLRSVLVTAALAVTATLAAAAPAHATGVTPGEYVALGDSFASGVGALPYDPASGACKQSPDSYPRTWARNHPAFTLRDMTCSGATIADVRNRQMAALSTATTLVTVTVGGNDDGFTNTVTACLTGTDAECKYATDLAAYYARTQLADDLAALYTDIRARAPHARVLVLGYPRLVDEGTGSCGALSPSAANRKQVTHNADHLAAGIADAAGRAGVRFVEMRLPFLGHEACGADPWINGVDPAQLSEIFHPNRYGHAVVYTFMLTAEINKL
ncbi:lysophospholipase L1-like esterase [Catenuloplanes nepalensis]|uniref:Lysophospholipase L1-like esterase n=1 Tax=Catenuloplanes nepalensis TaxID=587533 RepID=A0ABT9MPB9_9ACTN|nr:SGNH/GDSL hydrolase family protein [Catenuloplanes nepalensis]MDP9793269.1 lysophospholipase L1-like esterase [Catenuloplanes nepalensis]